MSDSAQEQSKSRDGQASRLWPRGLFVLALLALLISLYWVIYRLPEPVVTLAYVRALVWPTVVVVAGYWVREPLRDKLAQLLDLKAYGVVFNFGRELSGSPVIPPDTETLRREVADDEAQPVEKHASDSGGLIVEEGSSADRSFDNRAETSGPEGLAVTDSDIVDSSNFSRAIQRRLKRNQDKAAIEEIIRESATWGYDMANLGFKTTPTPVIEWTEDGRPIIVSGRGEIGQVVPKAQPSPSIRDARRTIVTGLEQEIRDLETEIYSNLLTGQGVGQRMRLDKLKAQLRRLDPDSPLGLE